MFISTKYLIFLLAVVILHRAVPKEFDPAIPCKASKDCVGLWNTAKEATCIEGFCVCRNNGETRNCSSLDMKIAANRSTADTKFRICKLDQDCGSSNAFCNRTMNQCECKRDYVWSDVKKTCLKKAETLDFPCVDKEQCVSFLRNTTCENGLCACIAGYHYAQNACYKTIDIGKRCTRTEECGHVNGAVCTDRELCDCPESSVISEDRKKCLPVAREMLQNCTENAQCAESFHNSLCINRSCLCQDQYHFEAEMNRCFIDRRFGENCANTYECYQAEDENPTEKSLKCEKNVCVCSENYHWQENRCLNEGSRTLPSVLLVSLATVAFSGRR